MAALSRRNLLRGLLGASCTSVLPLAIGCRKNKARFEIKFTGPMAFVSDPQKKNVSVFVPYTSFCKHFPVVYTDSSETLLDDHDHEEYILAGVSPSEKPQTPTEPLIFSIKDPSEYAYKNCRLALTIPRPDEVKGIHLVGICLNKKSQGAKPTGLRFIYYSDAVNSNSIFLNKKGGSKVFSAKFDENDPKWELNIRMIPKDAEDPSHATAHKSFDAIMDLCSIPNPILSYSDEDGCEKPRNFNPFFGPGSDCQVISVWVNAQ